MRQARKVNDPVVRHEVVLAAKRNQRGFDSTADTNDRRILRRRRLPFPFGSLRRLQTNGQLGTWLTISTAKLRSVTGEANS